LNSFSDSSAFVCYQHSNTWFVCDHACMECCQQWSQMCDKSVSGHIAKIVCVWWGMLVTDLRLVCDPEMS